MTQYRLASTAWVYTPGFIQWILAHATVQARRKMLRAAFPELNAAAAAKVLAGDFKVEGEDVVVEV